MSDVVLSADKLRDLFKEQRRLRDEIKRLRGVYNDVTRKISAARMIDDAAVTLIELEGFGKP